MSVPLLACCATEVPCICPGDTPLLGRACMQRCLGGNQCLNAHTGFYLFWALRGAGTCAWVELGVPFGPCALGVNLRRCVH